MWSLALLLACASASEEDSAAGPEGSYPSDTSAEGIAAFVQAGAWSQAPWVAESEAPREASSVSSPHGRVQVFFNDLVMASAQAGEGIDGTTPFDAGSMVVKVLHAEDDSVLGHAAMLKLDGGFAEWVYWCEGPGARCGADGDQESTWGIGLDTSCGACHGGNVFNLL